MMKMYQAADKFLKKICKTRRDLSVWIIASFWLSINLGAMIIWGRHATIFSNPIALGLITVFVFWSKRNKKVNSWLDEEL